MPNFSYHYVCSCGQLSNKLEKGQYLRLINKVWLCPKCTKKEQKETLFPLSNGTVANKSEF